MATVIASLNMSAEGRRAAKLDGGHSAALRRRERSAVLLTVSLTVAAEDVRHLRRAGGHGGRSEVLWHGRLWCDCDRSRQQIERAGCGADLAGRDSQVTGCRGQAAMSQ